MNISQFPSMLIICLFLSANLSCSKKFDNLRLDSHSTNAEGIRNDYGKMTTKKDDNDIAGSEVGNGNRPQLPEERYDLYCKDSQTGPLLSRNLECKVGGKNAEKISNIKWVVVFSLPGSESNQIEIESDNDMANIELPDNAEDVLIKSIIFTDDEQIPSDIENLSMPENEADLDQGSDSTETGKSKQDDNVDSSEPSSHSVYTLDLDYNGEDRFGEPESSLALPSYGNLTVPLSETANSSDGFNLGAWIKINTDLNDNISEARIIEIQSDFRINLRWSASKGYWARFMCGDGAVLSSDTLLPIDETNWNYIQFRVKDNQALLKLNDMQNTSVKLDISSCDSDFPIKGIKIGPNNATQEFEGQVDDLKLTIFK